MDWTKSFMHEFRSIYSLTQAQKIVMIQVILVQFLFELFFGEINFVEFILLDKNYEKKLEYKNKCGQETKRRQETVVLRRDNSNSKNEALRNNYS